MLGVGVLGPRELDQLDLLELVLADDAARVLAGGSGLGAEARRVGRQRDGQPGFVENLVAIEVGDGNLGGGDQPVVVVFELAARSGLGVGIGAAEQILGKLGQLAGAEERLGVDHEGRQHLGVAVLLGVQVEHEADQRPLQPRSRAHVDGEARPAQLGGAFEVENAERLADLPVRLGLEVECCGFSPQVFTVLLSASDLPTGTSSRVRLGTRARDWRNCSSRAGGGLVQLVELVFERAGLFHHGRGWSFLAGFLERAHLLAQARCGGP